MTMPQLTHPDDRVASTNVAVHVRDNGTDVKRFEKRYLHKSGRIVWARITAHRLDHDSSQEKRTLSVVEDITTARAIERELVEARDQAIASGLAKTQFLANMSHEIRTPLNGILGNLELLQSDSLLPEQRKCSDDALASGRILLEILNDILNFSKIGAGQTALDPAPFEWRSVFEGIEKTYGSVFREKGVQLELITEPSVPVWLLGDSLRLRQIVNNLVSNALKFTEKGKVSVHAAMGASDYLHIMIKDTGIGISTENIGKLFTPFTQADSSTTRRFGGTGLGLSISRELSRLMGGDISIESADGVGTTFTVCVKLPACDAPVGGTTGAATTAGEPVRPMRILVAEDNLINQGLTRRILEKAGHTVVIASNGDEALQAMTKSTFDVILMDCQMPVMDGFEATSRIIALYGDKRPPIIALTANAFKEDEERCLAVGMDHYLSKPLAKKQLDAILCKIAARTVS
jgi:two-component system, sensor histidine kinase SagS